MSTFSECRSCSNSVLPLVTSLRAHSSDTWLCKGTYASIALTIAFTMSPATIASINIISLSAIVIIKFIVSTRSTSTKSVEDACACVMLAGHALA
jgi:hypothetical protein